MNPKKRLGEMLMDAGIIDETQLKSALGHQRQWGVRLGQALVDLKLATEADIVHALSAKFGFPVADLGALEPYALEQAMKLIPRDFAVRNNVFPMAADTASLTVAMSDPTNLSIVDEIQFRSGRRVKVCMGGDREVAEAVKHHYPADDTQVEAIALDLDVDEGQSEAVFDPFGGGSKDALDAFFGHGPEVGAVPELTAPDPAASAAAPARPRAPAPQPSSIAAARSAPPRATPVPPTKLQAPAAAAPRTPAHPAAPARAPSPASVPAAPAPAPPRPAAPPPRAAALPSGATPASASPAPRAAPAPAPAAPAPRRAPAAPAPAAAPPAAALEIEQPSTPAIELPDVFADAAEPAFALAPAELAPFPEQTSGGEPVLATDLTTGEAGEAPGPQTRPLTSEEVAILDALDRLAEGHHAEPNIVKPTQAMAALVRLLLRKRIITEQEFLDEFGKK